MTERSPMLSARSEVLQRFKGEPPGTVRHFGLPARVEAALLLAREGWLRCEWVLVSSYDGGGSGKTMLACVVRREGPWAAPPPITPLPSGGSVA